MADLIIPYPNHVPGSPILAQEENTNNQEIADWANNHEASATGVHGVGTGAIPGTKNNNVWEGINVFTGPVDLPIPALISNARLSYAAGVLRLVGENGAAPSPTNPVYFRYWVPGLARWNTLSFTSATNCVLQDSTSADSYFYNGVAGTPFGTTAGVAWGQAMPLFIYVTTTSTGPCLFLSRKPNLYATPNAVPGYIGYNNVPSSNTTDSSIFAWSATNPGTFSGGCQLVGYLQAFKNTNDDWNFLSPTTVPYAGIGSFTFETLQFFMPAGQNGATGGSYFNAGGSTPPTYTSVGIFNSYFIKRSGLVLGFVNLLNLSGGSAGSGSDTLLLSPPFRATSAIAGSICGSGRFRNAGVYKNAHAFFYSGGIGFNYNYATSFVSGAVNSADILCSDQSNAAREAYISYAFQLNGF
jgi:hypothetical protein